MSFRYRIGDLSCAHIVTEAHALHRRNQINGYGRDLQLDVGLIRTLAGERACPDFVFRPTMPEGLNSILVVALGRRLAGENQGLDRRTDNR